MIALTEVIQCSRRGSHTVTVAIATQTLHPCCNPAAACNTHVAAAVLQLITPMLQAVAAMSVATAAFV